MPREAARARRTQEERSATTREALVRAAIDCICEVGYAGTTTTIIAERAQVTRGAVQHHFHARDDLILAVIDVVQRELNFGVDVDRIRKMALRARVDALIDRYRNVFSDKSFLAALNIWLGVASEPALYQRVLQLIEQVQKPIEDGWREVFHDLDITEEQLQSTRRMIVGAIRGYTIQELFGTAGSWAKDSLELRSMAYDHFRRFRPRRARSR